MAGIKKKGKTISLFQLFLRQIIWLAFSIFLEMVIAIFIFIAAFQFHVILTADYAQNYVSEHEKQITQANPFTADLLPYMCTYGLYDENKNYIKGNFSKQEKQQAMDFINGNDKNGSEFSLITRSDGYCVIHYDIRVHFKSQLLDKIIPQVEITFWLLFLFFFIMLVIINAYFFGKKLKKQFQPLLLQIEKIKEKDLDFEEEHSRVKEIDDILNAVYDMKSALFESLQEEWNLKQQKRSNIRALAHDIKTPITVMKGNAQLILEEEDIKNAYELAEIIDENADKIENYLKLLIEETKDNMTVNKQEKIPVFELCKKLKNEIQQFCVAKGVNVSFFEEEHTNQKTKSLDPINENETVKSIYADKTRILRAVLNMVGNATEYTQSANPKMDILSEIMVSFYEKNNYFCIQIADNGTGFSKEALLHAKEQFFTMHKERQSSHYGMGLYFTNEVAKEYGGYLTLENRTEGGAKVVFAVSITR